MRPTTIITLIAGFLLALGAGALGVYILFNHSGGKLWFYWIAPLLALGTRGDVAQPDRAVSAQRRARRDERPSARPVGATDMADTDVAVRRA